MDLKELLHIAEKYYKKHIDEKERITKTKIKSDLPNLSKNQLEFVYKLVQLFNQTKTTFSDLYDQLELLKDERRQILGQLKKRQKSNGKVEYLLKEIESELYSVDIGNILSDYTTYFSNKSKLNKPKKTEDIVILLSDTHFGEVVELISPQGEVINRYNFDIAKDRLKQLLDKLINLTKIYRDNGCNSIHICLLGDMVSGYGLHDELDITNEFDIAKQILLSSELITSFILELTKYFPTVNVYGVPGNHGRTQKKKNFKQATSNYDYLTYKIVEKNITTIVKYSDKIKSKVNFNISEDLFLLVNIRENNVLLTHGDNIKSWNSIPYYGMMRDYIAKQELSLSIYNQPVNYILMGHFHHPIIINKPLGGIIVNGTLKGIDEYSLANNWIYKPCQVMFGINEDGKTFIYEIEVQ